MENIDLSSNFIPDVTPISNIFIDEYMPEADGSYVKVYLYLLRCLRAGNMRTSVSDVADILETSERDITRAISYWERKGLISLSKDETGNINSILFETPKAGAAKAAPCSNTAADMISSQPVADNENTSNVIPMPVAKQIIPLEALLDDDDFSQMKIIIEKMLERPINSVETNLIVNLYSKYNFTPDLIIHLFDYCISSNKLSSSMIERIGMDWAVQGINSVDKAKDYTLEYSDIYYAVIKAFGIKNRSLGSKEREFILKWNTQYGYGADIISRACSKTLSTIHQQSFKYADSIISNWFSKNVHNIKDIELLDQKHEAETKAALGPEKTGSRTSQKNQKNVQNFNFEQRSYSDEDYDSLEKRALSKYLN